VSEPRTHYQISLTARQAVGIFAGLLLALGVAFFFGLMAGYSGRQTRDEKAAGAPVAAAALTPVAGSEPMPPVETGVPLVGTGAVSKADAALTPAPEPTTPATLHPFEDSAEDEASVTPAPGSRTAVVGARPPAPAEKGAAPSGKAAAAPKTAAAPAGKVWVQAASLSSHDEAAALGARLSKHGFHAVVLPASGPKGKVYRVRVGPYHSEDDASRAMAKLSKQEKIREPWIVPDGK
jgi:cell division septation protein DedD